MRQRRLVVASLAMLTAVSLALPATAAPPDGKGKPPDFVDVTMALAGPEGLATTCPDADGIAGSLRMKRTNTGLNSVDGIPPLLELHMSDVSWSRRYPTPTSGLGFAECHGGWVDRSPGEWEGFLSIGLDSAGQPTDIVWHFDYYLSSIEVPKGNKTQEKPYIREHYTLSGPLRWDAATSTATGSLWISYYFNDYINGGEILYQPFPGSPRPMAFTISIASAG